MMNPVEIGPIAEAHIESFHKTLDFIARERRYLAFLQAPPIDSTRAFILNNISRGYPQWVATSAGEVVGWCDITLKDPPSKLAQSASAKPCCAGREIMLGSLHDLS